MSIKITGTAELMKVLTSCENSRSEFQQIIKDTTFNIERDSIKNVHPHYDTGTLEKSASSTIKNLSGEVGYSVHYAPHLEYGHRTKKGSFVKGVKFLFNAAEDNRDAHIREVNDLVRRLTNN